MSNETDALVWVSATGTWHERRACAGYENAESAPLREAVEAGHGPCGTCVGDGLYVAAERLFD